MSARRHLKVFAAGIAAVSVIAGTVVAADAATSTAKPSGVLVGLGDSFNSGYGVANAVKAHCGRSVNQSPIAFAGQLAKMNTVNLACAGAQSSALKSSFGGDVPQLTALKSVKNVTAIAVSLGYNDVASNGNGGKLTRATLPAHLDADYVAIKAAAGSAKVYVTSYPLMGPDYLNASIAAAAKKAGFTYVDASRGFTRSMMVSSTGANGAGVAGHPTAAGNKVIAQALVNAMKRVPVAVVSVGKARDMYKQPFAWDSIWNLPLGKSAKYGPAGLNPDDIYIDYEDISVDPSFPVKTLDANGKKIQVHSDPALTADGSWNNCASFLTTSAGNKTFVQGQPLKLTAGGDPSYPAPSAARLLTGDGIRGCHGGSGLSGLGGDIRKGELPGSVPITHALKVGLDCMRTCSQTTKGFRWPAVTQDGGYDQPGDGNYYGGSNPEVKMGALLALPPNVDITQFKNADVRKVAQAMQTYGAYVVDTTATAGANSIDVQHGAEKELPSIDSGEMVKLFRMLKVVTNNTVSTPGGAPLHSPRRAVCVGPFVDGTGGAPPGC